MRSLKQQQSSHNYAMRALKFAAHAAKRRRLGLAMAAAKKQLIVAANALTTVLIPTRSGMIIKVDAADAATVRQFCWHTWTTGKRRKLHYARTVIRYNGKPIRILLHRLIMGDSPANAGMVIDHIDGDGLNNCRANLRWVTQADNMVNTYIARQNPAIALKTQRYSHNQVSIDLLSNVINKLHKNLT